MGAFILLGFWLSILRLFKVPHPPVGLYIGALAFVAAIVTIWPPDNVWSKAGWFLVFGGFLVLEITTLYQQRAEDVMTANKNRMDEDDRFAKVLKNQQENFTEVLRKDREQFQSTVTHVDSVARLAQESLANITGKNSFPYIVPQTHSGTETIPLFMWDHGRHLLSGVTFTIKKWGSDGILTFPEMDVGVLHPGWGRPLKAQITPHPDTSSGIDSYDVEMYTQSEFFTEVLQFRKGRNQLRWAYQYWVQRHLIGDEAKRTALQLKLSNAPNANFSLTITVLSTKGWSDDLGDGRPSTPKPQ
ncbi:MAG: hypothetical protein M3Y24_00320 [Acidobacteriota bacterium]|nr:hypothetical protein [Acidobacteriota bacterium]